MATHKINAHEAEGDNNRKGGGTGSAGSPTTFDDNSPDDPTSDKIVRDHSIGNYEAGKFSTRNKFKHKYGDVEAIAKAFAAGDLEAHDAPDEDMASQLTMARIHYDEFARVAQGVVNMSQEPRL